MRKLKHLAGALWQDTQGIILPYATVMLVVLVGLSVLAIDGARYVSLQTQLQNGADALALAAAAELDGTPTACTRAQGAIANLVANSTLYGATGAQQSGQAVAQNVQVSSQIYLKSLPASDATAITGPNVCPNTPGDAHFVQVTVQPVTLPTILPASFFGGTNTATAGATAVAGFNQTVCKFTPMFICNPFEPIGNTDYDAATAALQNAVQDPAQRRRLIDMRQNTGSGSYFPGDYGFLASSIGNGANNLRDALARTHPPACFNSQGVTTEPGFISATSQGINVRFDLYSGPMNSVKNNVEYAPALDVRKGYVISGGGACNAQPAPDPTQARPFPIDNDQIINPSIRIGDGQWDFDNYWNTEHPGVARPNGWTSGTLSGATPNYPSRYQVYQYEISQGNNPGGLKDASPGGEIGSPQCSSQVPPANIDRRILFGAVLNCQALGLGNGKENNVPVAAFAKFFVTQPVAQAQSDIDAELNGLVNPGDNNGVNVDNVQLYR